MQFTYEWFFRTLYIVSSILFSAQCFHDDDKWLGFLWLVVAGVWIAAGISEGVYSV